MRHLMALLAVVALVLCASAAYADCGEQLAQLVPGDRAPNDLFGQSVAISGTTAIIGAYGDEENGIRSGSAYVFDISDPTNPVEIAELVPDLRRDNVIDKTAKGYIFFCAATSNLP